MVTMIEPPTSGALLIDGVDVAQCRPARRAARLRSEVQIVFQDPYGSLNPRQKIGAILEEPLKINRRGMAPADRRRAGARHDGAGRACGRSTTTATRTCSRAASGSGSPSPAR